MPKKLDTNDITDFLGNLAFAVDQPDDEELVKIIKLEIGRQYPNKDVDTIYCYLLTGVLNWFKKYSAGKSTNLTKENFEKFRTIHAKNHFRSIFYLNSKFYLVDDLSKNIVTKLPKLKVVTSFYFLIT